MCALRAGDSDKTPAIGSPPGCLSALDPYPDLVCESHRTLSNRSSMASLVLAPALMKGSPTMMSPCLLYFVSGSSPLGKRLSHLQHYSSKL